MDFVISGYLISKIIINDLIKKKFSLKKFLFKESKKNFPALIPSIYTLILSFIFLKLKSITIFIKQLAFVFLFLKNFLRPPIILMIFLANHHYYIPRVCQLRNSFIFFIQFFNIALKKIQNSRAQIFFYNYFFISLFLVLFFYKPQRW